MVLADTAIEPPEVISSAPESVKALTAPADVEAFKVTEPVPLVVSILPTVTSPLLALTAMPLGALKLVALIFEPVPDVLNDIEPPVVLMLFTVIVEPAPDVLNDTEPPAALILFTVIMPDELADTESSPATIAPSVSLPVPDDEKLVDFGKLAAVVCRVYAVTVRSPLALTLTGSAAVL